MSGFFHPCQSFLKTIQNNFCLADRRRRGRLACNARSCWRKARFSRMRSCREQKALMIQPMRCRSDATMADILSEARNPSRCKSFILGLHDVLMRDRGKGAWKRAFGVSEELLCCRVLGCHGKRLDVAELS